MEVYQKCDKCGELTLNAKRVTIGFVLLYEPGHWCGSGFLCNACFQAALQTLQSLGFSLRYQNDEKLSEKNKSVHHP